jgi:hypothetical protein
VHGYTLLAAFVVCAAAARVSAGGSAHLTTQAAR